MKTTAFIVATISGFCLHAYAQQDNQAKDRQPPVVTEQQVDQHAQMAQEERKNDERTRYEPVKQKTERQEDKGTTTGSVDIDISKKSSKKPEEQ